MSDNIEYRDEAGGVTYIAGKKVSIAWRFISNGTWFDEGDEPKLETDCGWCGGAFRGNRTSQGLGELRPKGTKYKDGELCDWIEFDIYDENGTLLRKADPYNEKTAGVKYIDVNFKVSALL